MTGEPIPVVPGPITCAEGLQPTHAAGPTSKGYTLLAKPPAGLHGANRLASNSLAEALVYAHGAAIQAVEDLKQISEPSSPELSPWDDAGTTDSDELIMVAHNWDEIADLCGTMWVLCVQ